MSRHGFEDPPEPQPNITGYEGDFLDFDLERDLTEDSSSECVSLNECVDLTIPPDPSGAAGPDSLLPNPSLVPCGSITVEPPACDCHNLPPGPSDSIVLCKRCLTARDRPSPVEAKDQVSRLNEDEGLGLFVQDINESMDPVCVVDCEACFGPKVPQFSDDDDSSATKLLSDSHSSDVSSCVSSPLEEHGTFQHDWNWTSSSLRSYEQHPINRLCSGSSNKVYVSIAGPFGSRLNKDIFLPSWRIKEAMTKSSSSVCSSFDGDDFHTSLLKDSVPTFDYLLWSLSEAEAKQMTQMGPSSCGATAVANVLRAFGIVMDKDTVRRRVPTRIRAEHAGLQEYLLSRSVAGTSHEDLIEAVHDLTNEKIRGRFFHMFPRRRVYLVAWLLFWLKNGAVPILTLNCQRGLVRDRPIPDAWHHQMAFGGGARGIYVTNPLEILHESCLTEHLCSESMLLVKVSDVFHHWQIDPSLKRLALLHADWINHNVPGQVMQVVRQCTAPKPEFGKPWAGAGVSHITIPAAYKSGVTLYARADSRTWDLIQCAPELPLLEE